MICTTVKEGVNCNFMSKSGCTFRGGRCLTIVESCKGCDRVRSFASGEYCLSYANPTIKWEFGKCNFATHIKVEKGEQKMLNPLKASKRAMAGRK
jgi:hypothetical protein